ncbi:MAG: translocation/assembly module TamB domain-containing protein, partial [Myxococcota bacterium]
VTTYGTNPREEDTDTDGYWDKDEIEAGTDPFDADTDNDGLGDGTEANVFGSDPLDTDTDDDALPDDREYEFGTNPNEADTDHDDLTDIDELRTTHTDPADDDTDDDALADGYELTTTHTDPLKLDTDKDGLNDGVEVNEELTDPLVQDTDGDTLTDGQEVLTYASDPLLTDSDGDTLQDGDEVRTYNTQPALDDTEVPPGVFSAVVSVDDTLRDPVIHLAGVTELAVGEWASPGRVEFELTRRASELAYSADLREGVATRALIRGTGATAIGSGFSWAFDGGEAPDWSDPELYLNAIEASAVLVGVPAHSLLAAAGVDAPVSGDLVGGVAVSGSPTRPTFDGALNWLDPQIGDQPLTGAYLSFVPRDGAADRVVASAGSVPWTAPGYAVDLQLAFPDGGVQVQGDVPVAVDFDLDREQWVTGDLALDVSGAGVPLALLSAVDPRLRDARGQVIVAGKIGGTPVAPVPDLTATLTDGRVELVPLGVEAHDIDLALSVVDHVVTLDRADVVLLPSRRFQPVGLVSEATALVEGERPRVSITGRAELGLDGLPGRIDGAITLADGAWLSSTADATVRADGEVTVAGQWPALAIDGDVSVGYARIVLDAAALTEGTPLTLDPSLVVVRTGVAPTPSATAEPPLYSAFDVDLALDLNRNLELAMTVPFVEDLGALGAELSRADIATRLGGQLRVEVRGDAPVLVGQLDVVEGSVRMLRSSLALDEGSITFAGGDPYEDALLDLHGSMVVSGGTLEVAIAGSPESPTFTPSSEAYPDQTEQLAILLTGQAPDELSANQGDAVTRMVAQTVLASLLSGQSIGTLTIEPDNSVRLGVPLSPSMYASTLVRPMIVDPNQNLLAVQLEWSLAPRLVVSGGLGDQMGWGDLFWEVRF